MESFFQRETQMTNLMTLDLGEDGGEDEDSDEEDDDYEGFNCEELVQPYAAVASFPITINFSIPTSKTNADCSDRKSN
jgi:hypothetical protein